MDNNLLEEMRKGEEKFGFEDVTEQQDQLLTFHNGQMNITNPDDVHGTVKYGMDTETIYIQMTNIEYLLLESESEKKDNTDYFCGLFMNSASTETYSDDEYTIQSGSKDIKQEYAVSYTHLTLPTILLV